MKTSSNDERDRLDSAIARRLRRQGTQRADRAKFDLETTETVIASDSFHLYL